jgi:hypothetical protein
MSFQFFVAGPAHEVEGYHFKGSFCGFSSCPEGDEHAGDEGAIDLSCSICRSNSSLLAQPMKLRDIISKVLFVGFRPVQRVMSMLAMRAQ